MKNPVTTISGVILIVLSALSLFGIITAEEQASLGQYAASITEAVVGIIAIFKAGDKGGL